MAYSLTAAINGSLVGGTPRTGTLSIVEESNTLASVDISVTAPNSSGYYTLSIPAGFATGNHSLKLVYSGDSLYDSVTTNFTVIAATTLPTFLGAGNFAATATVGQPYTVNGIISGTLQPGIPRTGTLSLLEGGNTLASINIATTTPYTLTVPGGLAAGANTLVLTYSGDSTYASSTWTMPTVTAS